VVGEDTDHGKGNAAVLDLQVVVGEDTMAVAF